MNKVKINFGFFGSPPVGPIAVKVEKTEAVRVVLRAINVYLYS